MKYIVGNTGITFFIGNRPRKVEKGSVEYAKILKAFSLPLDKQDEAITKVLEGKVEDSKELQAAGFTFSGSEIRVDGDLLPQVLTNKINSLKIVGLPTTLFLNFWLNLRENPDFAVVHERGFYDFLEYKELPLTEDGCFIGYRGVNNDYWSKSGSKTTKVLQGKVDAQGRIFNGVGEVIEVIRNGVSTDKNVTCAEGSLHIGSLAYAKSWGNRVIIVKVNPKDVVSVAKDCSCQKLRVCKYEVIGDFEKEIVAPATKKDGKEIVQQDKSDDEAFKQRINNYLVKKANAGEGYVTLKQVQSIFSPKTPDKTRVLAAVKDLGYFYATDKFGDGKLWIEL